MLGASEIIQVHIYRSMKHLSAIYFHYMFLNPFMPVAASTDYLGDIILPKAMVGKYLKEICSSKFDLQRSF